MPVLSYIHQLFNAEHCHAYIHALRWKERPLQCPRSHSAPPWRRSTYFPKSIFSTHSHIQQCYVVVTESVIKVVI